MTKLKVSTSVALLFLVWVVGAGQTTDKAKTNTRPDLSGVWAFDNSKSNINLKGKEKLTDYVLSIVHHEQHMNEVDYNIWTEYGKDAPVYVLTHDGVPIISVYRRSPQKPSFRSPRR